MCVTTLTSALSSPGPTAADTIATGGNLVLLGSTTQAIASLAGGITADRTARANARAEEAAAAAQARRVRAAGERELSAARAGAVAGGVSLASGSVLEAERSVVRNVEQDAMSLILTGSKRAAALRDEGRGNLLLGAVAGFNTFNDGYGKWKRTRRTHEAPTPYIPTAGE